MIICSRKLEALPAEEVAAAVTPSVLPAMPFGRAVAAGVASGLLVWFITRVLDGRR